MNTSGFIGPALNCEFLFTLLSIGKTNCPVFPISLSNISDRRYQLTYYFAFCG